MAQAMATDQAMSQAQATASATAQAQAQAQATATAQGTATVNNFYLKEWPSNYYLHRRVESEVRMTEFVTVRRALAKPISPPAKHD